MTTNEYYRHMRSLAPFKASDALRVARQAAALDHASLMAKRTAPQAVCNETLPDGSGLIRLSFSINCF